MNKQELFKAIESKAIVKEGELEQLYNEKSKDFRERGIPNDRVEQFVLAHIKTYFKKQFISPSTKFKGIIIRDLGITDFGARKLYNEIKLRFNNSSSDDKSLMIKQGSVDQDGNPLWSADNFRKGLQINPEKDKQRKLLLLSKKEEDKEYKITQLTLKNDKLNIKHKMFISSLFRANLRKEEDNQYFLNSASITEFVEDIDDNNKVDIVDLLKTNFKENILRNLSSLQEYHEKNKLNVNRFCIVKANIVNINLETTFSTILNLDDDSLPLDKTVTGFLNKDYEIDFTEGTIGAIVLGRTISRMNNNQEEISLAVDGIYVEDIWKRKEVSKVNPEEIVEEETW